MCTQSQIRTRLPTLTYKLQEDSGRWNSELWIPDWLWSFQTCLSFTLSCPSPIIRVLERGGFFKLSAPNYCFLSLMTIYHPLCVSVYVFIWGTSICVYRYTVGALWEDTSDMFVFPWSCCFKKKMFYTDACEIICIVIYSDGRRSILMYFLSLSKSVLAVWM